MAAIGSDCTEDRESIDDRDTNNFEHDTVLCVRKEYIIVSVLHLNDIYLNSNETQDQNIYAISTTEELNSSVRIV